MATAVLTRSYDAARSGANTQETILTPQNVGNNLLVKLFSLKFDDDPRLEAQPLYVPGVMTSDRKVHDVVYVCTMANNVWAFDATDGTPIWNKPVSLGRPIKPAPKPHPGFPNASEIDMWGINFLWGILSTPVIDPDAKRMYVVCWTSSDGTVPKAVFNLHEIDISSGSIVRHIPIDTPPIPGSTAKFLPSKQKQRAALLLTTTATRKTIFVACGMTHEEGDPSHGWVLAFDIATFRRTAAWCTTPHGSGSGIWQAGQGPAADEQGDIYVMTGNYGVEQNHRTVPPAQGDLPESFVKLHYTPPASATSQGKLEAVAWFTPFTDAVRPLPGENGAPDNFQDYDLGSGGPVPITGMSLVVGAGKDGVLYVLDRDAAKFGQGSDFSKLKQQPIFFTYFPGFGIDAAQIANLNRFYDGKTHHLHGSPVFWNNPTLGPMLFVWGENECLRAWRIAPSGVVTFVAKSAAVASAGMGGIGGMPGGFPTVSANGNSPNTGIVWATAPLNGDANKHVVEGILRAYDATNLDPVPNADGTPRLKRLWDSKQIPNNTFNHCKFCPPFVADGKIFVPTYDGRVDVYGLVTPPHMDNLPTNANGL
jgi:outer membrane protein assembly factor BamB